MECFDATVGGRFDALAELDIDELWGNFTSAVNDAAKKSLGSVADLRVSSVSSMTRLPYLTAPQNNLGPPSK